MNNKIILAYSGGLDTTTIIPWLKENYNSEVIAVCINVGQGDLDGLQAKALKYGASECLIIDCVDKFCNEYLTPMLKANATYEGKYLLGSSIARPLISETLVNVAKEYGANTICHGATGKGNDQVRFELSVKALAPEMKIIAPWRIWDIKSREDAIDYLQKHNLEVPMLKEQSYSRDENIWHVSSEGLELENISQGPDLNKVLTISVPPMQAPDDQIELSLTFKDGVPIALNGTALSFTAILAKLNTIGGAYGIGIVDMVENRIVGMKSRGVYETPGGTILYYAHTELELLCLDKEMVSFNQMASTKFAELIYNGKWHTPLCQSLISYFNTAQVGINGTINFSLYKGNISTTGMNSENSLYIEELASFATGDLYDHFDAQGFINLYGLPQQVKAMIDSK